MATNDDWTGYWVPPAKVPKESQEELAQKARDRLHPPLKPVFKPASATQMKEWSEWLESPGAINAAKHNADTEAQGKRRWNDYKFNPASHESHINGMWPSQQAEFLVGPKHLAYLAFVREQLLLVNEYSAKAKLVKTNKDYELAEKAYKDLLAHIHQHGKIYDLPDKQHEKSV